MLGLKDFLPPVDLASTEERGFASCSWVFSQRGIQHLAGLGCGVTVTFDGSAGLNAGAGSQ